MMCGLLNGVAAGALSVSDLTCEYRSNPLGIDTVVPRLGWVLSGTERGEVQTGYQVLVSGSRELLDRDKGDLWDSGRVQSPASVQVPYGGKPLESRTQCYWKVRAWDKAGNVSDWSRPGHWEMGLASEDWRAAWIDDGKTNPDKDEAFYENDPAPLFRREFRATKRVNQARLYISGLGYYVAWINGRRVGDRALDPGWTRYSERVLYSVYDVTDQLGSDGNCIGVTLGNGWYNPLPLRMWGRRNLRDNLPVGRPTFIAQLEGGCQSQTTAT